MPWSPAPIPAHRPFPACLLKLIATTLVAAIIFAGCYVVYTRRILTLDGLAAWFGFPN